jgi:hypothetical protein
VPAQVHVRVHEAGLHDAAASVEDSPGAQLALQISTATDCNDALAVHRHDAVREDPPLGIEGDHGTPGHQEVDVPDRVGPV